MEKEESTFEFLDHLCYVSEHIGFFGSIKNTCADFVVTEIDLSGRLVTEAYHREAEDAIINTNDKKKAHQEQLKKQPVTSKDIDHEVHAGFSGYVNIMSDASSEEIKDFSVEELIQECDADSCNLLNPLLDAAMQKSLNQFAALIKSRWKSQTSEDYQQELSLGLFPDKNERAKIHSVVRQTFPFLLTITKSTELLVKPNLDYKELCQLTSEEEADEFFTFLDAKVENSRFTFHPDACKEHRTSVHHFVSKKFGKLLETKSFSEKDPNGQQKAAITVRFRDRAGTSRKRHRTEDIDKHSVYTAFSLTKENLETMEAISCMSSLLGILPSDFSYAGIKDKKAVTHQAMVVKKVTPESLQQIGSSIERKGMKLYNIRSTNQHLRLGQLTGNHFSIAVRDVKHHSDDDASADIEKRIEEAICNVKMKGFINYYGPQRFGKGHSHEIGLALLKDEMEKAVKLLFTPGDTEDAVNKAKQYFLQTGDPKGSLTLMPDYKVRERMLLRALNRYGMNEEGFVRGWFSIPHSMRIFYTHAYCSKVWNEAASYRFLSYGSKAVEGDLVLCDQRTDEKTLLSDRVHVVTAAEENENVYTIKQVVLPMPGHSIKYPTNKVGQWYREALARDGLQTCQFRIGSLQLNLPGCYRHILKHPHKLSYALHQEKENKTENEDQDSPKQFLKLTFELDSSCYATVCLKEIMKCKF
ncbi:pseudouridylate synthase PUS7L [Spea bombifrons]|uniref:pseudouridylate synthase PUS7L n=1 Tax=Spea bombifrons TaxID=233779 RepID=UPI00234A1FB9|nr:pseudouridylate synthase PUS7L [Spea bombifrons]